jgi:hypothetical protein
LFDETLQIINKSKHPKKGKDPRPRKQKNHQMKATTREHQVPEPLLVTRSISNNERGGLLERMISLKEPSPITTTCFKHLSKYRPTEHVVMPLTPTNIMHTKL